MASDDEIKYQVLQEIWGIYETFQDTLLQAGVQKVRLPRMDKLIGTLEETPVNKMRHGKHWIIHFHKTHIEPYLKVRAENTEQYWENAKLFNLGNSCAEVRTLNELAKKIRIEWFSQHNSLVIKKKPKEPTA